MDGQALSCPRCPYGTIYFDAVSQDDEEGITDEGQCAFCSRTFECKYIKGQWTIMHQITGEGWKR